MARKPLELKVYLSGSERIAKPFALNGTSLFAYVEGMRGSSVIMEFMATDKQAFWDCWRSLGGEQLAICYDDGTPYEAPYPPAKAKTFVERVAVLWAALWAVLFPWTVNDNEDLTTKI